MLFDTLAYPILSAVVHERHSGIESRIIMGVLTLTLVCGLFLLCRRLGARAWLHIRSR